MDNETGREILAYLQSQQAEMTELLASLVRAESPSTRPETQEAIFTLLADVLLSLDYQVRRLPGRQTGGHLLARPAGADLQNPYQLLLGHCDTVWPVGTLNTMPLQVEGNIMRGPGVFDMKGGLVQMLFALRALRALSLWPALPPVVFINSDEETGSLESGPHIERLATTATRAFVVEPAYGPAGHLKTARKGVGKFHVTVTGRAAHAGLDPEKGRSAILELAHVIQKLHALNDLEAGISVNVGVISGGERPNVIAPHSEATVDLRVPTGRDGERLEQAILSLTSTTPGTTLTITGGIERGPLERTPANQALWQLAHQLGQSLGMELEQATVGGGSDGNITSQYTATLDGLGAVGDGAHAAHEFIYLDKMAERSTLLALLLMTETP